MRKKSRGNLIIEFIETFCLVPEGALVGQPIKLEPFQKRFIKAVYDNKSGTEKAILSIARKNGKTSLIASLLLAHLVGPEAKKNSQIVSGAMSREQAALVFNLAVKMIDLSPKLKKIIGVVRSGKRLIGLLPNTEYKALAAEGKTAQGLSPVLAILDEVGQVKGSQNDFVDAIVTAQGAHEHPLLITISTQAASDADLLSIWIDDAQSGNDPHTVCHLYAAEQDADILDKKAWKAANPALGKFRNLRDMEKLAQNAARMPSQENTFRNLNLNQRVSTVNPFVSPEVWKSCSEMPRPLDEMLVYGGLDLSAHTDLTALVLVGRDYDGVIHVHPYFWTPEQGLLERAKRDRSPYDLWVKQGYLRTTPGATVDYDYIAAELGDILFNLKVANIAFDRWNIHNFQKSLDRQGLSLNMVNHGQGFKDMTPAIKALEADLLNGRMRHGGHPVLQMCAANAVIESDAAGNRKFTKRKATGRIDGMVALAMALTVIETAPEEVDIDEYLEDIIIA